MLRILNGLLLFLFVSQTAAETLSETELVSEHERGVDVARNGEHIQGLQILLSLLQRAPDYYPAQRDAVIIASWSGDCDQALQLYEPIKDRPNQESYLIAPVSDCLYKTGHKDQAFNKLDTALASTPDNDDLKNMRATLQARKESEPYGIFTFAMGNNESDQGAIEWSIRTSYTHIFENSNQLYARFVALRAIDPHFETGKVNRLALGLQVGLFENWYVRSEYSADVQRENEEGVLVLLAYSPSPLWHFELSHASFSEDLPLRAKALAIEGDRNTLAADFHTANYGWTWSAAASQYRFSDDNERDSLYTEISYAYVLQDRLEQRLRLGYYTATNTLDNTIYYNPQEEQSLTLTHQLDYVYDSRFQRHVDHLYLYIGYYSQEGQKTNDIWGMSFSQDYEYDKYHSVNLTLAYRNAVYDGQDEAEHSAMLSYRRNLI